MHRHVVRGYNFNSCPCPGSLLGKVSVPFDLVKKHPKGEQTFALKAEDTVTGSLTTEVGKPSPLILLSKLL